MATRMIIHHLYRNPGDDVLPVCGTTPGPDELQPSWHTGHSVDYPIAYRGGGHPAARRAQQLR
jgi:hypothetical protein